MIKKIIVLGQPEVSHLICKLWRFTGLCQERFAEKLKVAFSTINQWENAHIQPSPLVFKQIKTALSDFSGLLVVKLVEGDQTLLEQYFSEVGSSIQ